MTDDFNPGPEFRRRVEQKAARLRRRRRGVRIATGLAALGVVGASAAALATSSGPSRQGVQVLSPSTLAKPSPTTSTPPASTATSSSTTSTTVAVSTTASLACSTPGTTTSSPVSVTDGAVTVTVTWTSPGEAGGPAIIGGGRIVLRDNGTTLFDEPLAPPYPANDLPMTKDDTSSWARGWEQASPCVEIPGIGRPLVYLNGWAEGMTCCGVERVYYPLPGGSYAALDRDQGRESPSEEVLGGEVVIMGYNRDWNSHYSCGACAGPIQIMRLQGGEYLDVTREFPNQIRADAAQLLKLTTPPYSALIPLAGWVADECELGRQDQAFSTLDSMQSQGQLTPPAGTPADNFGYTLTGAAYLVDLHSFLRQEGYCT